MGALIPPVWQLDTNPKGTVTSIHGSSFTRAKDILYNYIYWYWSFVDQLTCSFSVCTMANGELLYPLHIASCVCLRKKVLLRHTYICHTLPAFIPSQTDAQMWCKYLAVALTQDTIQVVAVRPTLCLLDSGEDNELFPFTLSQPISVWTIGLILSSSATPSLHSTTPLSSLTIGWLLAGWMQRGQKQKSPGNKMLVHHRGSSSSPAFLMQAASVCVSAAANTPLGGQRRLKRLEFRMSSQSHFHPVLFGFLLLSVCGGSFCVSF